MKISPHPLPNVAATRQTLPDPSEPMPRHERTEAPKSNPSAARANPPPVSTLSPETNWDLVQATQQEPSPSEHAAKSPAHAARALIATRPDLADLPFGKVVSMLARGLTPPAAPEDLSGTPAEPDTATNVEAPPADVEAPETAETAGDPETPRTPLGGEEDPDGATQAALSLLDALDENLAAQASPETDPTDLLDPA